MSQRALEIGELRRRELALGSMHAGQVSRGTFRHAAGAAVMRIGRLIYGEMPDARQREAGARPGVRLAA